jgi:glyoxylase-like metal-dependent hydrolase (beta-lactamase superfamily II)
MIPWGYYEVSDGVNLFKLRYYVFISPASPSIKRMRAKQKSHLYDVDDYIIEEKTRWLSGQELLKMYQNLDSLVSPATIHFLSQVIIENKKIYEVARELENRKQEKAAISNQILPFVWRFSLPSTSYYQSIKTTNCYVVGDKIKYIIDPGSEKEEETKPLVSMIDEAPEQYEGILITDYHKYSFNRANFLKNKFNIPIFTSLETSELLKDQNIEINSILHDNDILPLSDRSSEDCNNKWYLKVISVPGHTKGSLAFYDSRGILFTGDTILKEYFTTVDPEQGSISDLVESLRKLKNYPTRFGLANQGEIIIKTKRRAWINIYFRKKLLKRIYDSMKKGNETADDIAEDFVPLLPEELQSAAKWGVLNFLKMLEEKESVIKRGENYILKKKIKL